MLDPFTCVGLAAAIVQFIDFSTTLLSKAGEIRRAGSLVDLEELNLIVKDLSQLAKCLQFKDTAALGSSTPSSQNEAVSIDVFSRL